jgi:thiamine kinase-like enzyme
MTKGKLISAGHCAEVFSYDSDHILKLYYPWLGEQQAVREAELTRFAYESGAPAPRIKNIIQQGNRTGLVIEHLKGPTLTELSAAKPWKIHYYASVFARLHVQIHQLPAIGIPRQRMTMRTLVSQSRARLGEQVEKIHKKLDELPDEYFLCHNDLHQENIIFTSRGPVVIDWAEALCGHPHADVMHALLVQERSVPVPGKPDASRIYAYFHNRHRKWFGLLYLKEYLRLTGASQEEIRQWALPVAAARLVVKPANETEWTEAFIRRKLNLLS